MLEIEGWVFCAFVETSMNSGENKKKKKKQSSLPHKAPEVTDYG